MEGGVVSTTVAAAAAAAAVAAGLLSVIGVPDGAEVLVVIAIVTNPVASHHVMYSLQFYALVAQICRSVATLRRECIFQYSFVHAKHSH
eukprot:COSAG01_NODE_23693_length_805_cov_1.140227_2_plen_89_part_00